MPIVDHLREKLSSLSDRRVLFDPASLDDPVALKTEWTPAKGGGSNFGTHHLEKISSSRVEFKPSTTAILFPALFMLAGLVAGIGMSIAGLKDDITMLLIGLPLGTLFFLVGFFVFRSWSTPRIFDRQRGIYWRGRETPTLRHTDKRTSWPLESVHAVQLISEYCSGNSSSGDEGSRSFYSYELNLIFQDGRRTNVVDHGKRSLIAKDARSLAAFLDVPLWDAT